MAEAKRTLHVEQVRSAIGRPEIQEKTLRSLGLGRIGKSNDLPNNESVIGLMFKVQHLIAISEVESGKQLVFGKGKKLEVVEA